MKPQNSFGSGLDKLQLKSWNELVAWLKKLTGKRKPFAYFYVSIGLIPPIALLLFSLWNEGFNHFDMVEQSFAGAIAQLKTGKNLYRDFAFVQMPIMPWFYNAILPHFGNDLPLQVEGKMLTFFLAGINVLLMGWASLAITRSSRVSMAIGALYAFSENLFRTSWEFSHHTLTVTFWLLAMACFYEGFRRRRLSIPFTALSSVFLGWAICTHILLAPLLLPFAYFAFWVKKYPNYGALLGWVLGFGLGMTPALVSFIENPESFQFSVLEFPVLYAKFLNSHTETLPNMFTKILWLFGQHLIKTVSFMAVLAISYGIWVIKRKSFFERLWKDQWLGWSLPMVSGCFMIAPILMQTEIKNQYLIYLTMPLLLSIASLYRWMPQIERPRFRKVLLLASIFAGVHFLNAHASNWKFNKSPYREALPQVCADNLRQVLANKKSLVCASLLPGLAADANLITPNLFTGGISPYLIADSLLFDKQVRMAWVGPKRAYSALTQTQPDVIIIGWKWPYSWVEKPLIAYAYVKKYRFNTIPSYELGERLVVLSRPNLFKKENPTLMDAGFKIWLKENGLLPDTLIRL